MTHPIRQLFLVLAGFVAVIVLLESDGLANWADRLEVGPLRTVAVPVTGAVQRALEPLGLSAIRQDALESLARVGWADDAAQLAAAAGANRTPLAGCGAATAKAAVPGQQSAPSSGVAGVGSIATANTPLGLRTSLPNPVGADVPLAAQVPRTTALAPLPPVEPGRQRVVVLAGDSMMAVGISATLMRQAAGNRNLRIVKAFRSGTGLARPEVFNWMDEYPAMVGTEKPDVVIVAIGANDGQGFVVDGKVLPYGSDGWRKVYQGRLAAYLAMVGAGGARVVWVGLPPMRVPVYDEKIAIINRIAYTVVSQSPQAVWWNPVAYVGDEAGRFREFVSLPNGQTMRIRSADGIHLSDEGAALFTTVLMKWLDPPQPKPVASASVAPAPVVQTSPAAARPKRRARRRAKG
ncbi:MAG: DUF459 domain-containing protein [Terracidiphilus sp.]